MQAMSTGDPSKIQQCVARVRNWVEHWDDPATTVRVYSVFEASQMLMRPDGQREVPVKVKLVGQLKGGRDWYPATGDDTLTLVLDNDGPDFRGQPRRHLDAGRQLRPAVRLDRGLPGPGDPPLAAAAGAGLRPPGRQRPGGVRAGVERALEVLLDGPRGRYDHLDTAIPDGTVLRDFRYAEGVATVRPVEGFARARASAARVAQVVWTVNRLLPNTPAHPGRGPPGQDHRRRAVPHRARLAAPRHAAGRDAAAALPPGSGRLGPVRAQRRDLDGHAEGRPAAEAGAGRPRHEVGADPVARPPRHGLPGRQRRRAPALGDPARGRPGVPRRGLSGRLSPPPGAPTPSGSSWSAGRGRRPPARGQPQHPERPPPASPRFPTACS